MSKKKVTIAAGANPFDKSKSPADYLFEGAPSLPQEKSASSLSNEEENKNIGHVGEAGYVDNVEQQNQHIQQVQQHNAANSAFQQDDAGAGERKNDVNQGTEESSDTIAAHEKMENDLALSAASAAEEAAEGETEGAEKPAGKKRGRPRQFPGRQHIHLILPDHQADMIKSLAKMTGVSVNQFMIQAVDTMYEEHWKPVVEILQQNRHKLGLDRKLDKNLFDDDVD